MTKKKFPKKEKNLQYLNVAVEVKAIETEDEEFFRFEGLASTFGNVDLGGDVVLPGAFRESLLKRMPIILWQHDRWEPIGVPEIAEETAEGLFIRARLPRDDDLVKGRVIPQVKVGSIRTMSIGFRVVRDEFDRDAKVRKLIEVELFEVSLVTFAMNPQAVVTDFKQLDQTFTNEQKEILSEWLGLNKQKIITTDNLKFLDELETVNKRDLENALRESKLFSGQAALKLSSFLTQETCVDNEQKEIEETLNSLLDSFDTTAVENSLNSMLSKFRG